MDTTGRLVFLGMLLLFGLLQWFLPVVKGPDAFFGLTVPDEFYRGPIARRTLRLYRVLTVLFIVAAGAVVLAVGRVAWLGAGSAIAALLFGLLAPHVALIGFWYALRPHEQPHVVAPTARVAPARPAWWYFNPAIQSLSLAAVLVAVGVSVWRYPQLPSRLPTHWDIAGRADGWMPKSPLPIAYLVAMMAVLQVLWMWLLVGMARTAERLPAERVDEYHAAYERYMHVWATWVHVMQLAMLAMFGGILWASLYGISEQAHGAAPPGMIGVFIGTGVMLLSLPWLIIAAMRRRREMREVAGAGTMESTAPTEGWIAGAIYYNKNDPSVWVEKRVGIGWTLNMARPASWVFLAVILGLPIAFTIAMLAAAPK